MSTHFFGLKDWSFQYSHSLGRNEFGGTGFRNPVDMAVGADDIVYVVNRSREDRPDGVRVTMVTIDEDFISEFGIYGEGDGEFIWPSSVALDGEGNVYVADEFLNRVNVYNRDGEFIRKWGTSGSGNGEINKPAGMAIDGEGTVYLTDSLNHRVQKFGLDGKHIGSFGSFGSGSGQLNMPWGITLDNDGQVLVADWRNDRVQVFSPDGQWQASFGSSGTGIGQFNRPNGVAVDNEGLIYVLDWLNDRVQVLNPDGRIITVLLGEHELSQWGKEKLISNPDMIEQRALALTWDLGAFEKRLSHPCAVKVDSQNRIAVLENTSGRIQVYEKTNTPVLV